MKRTKKAVLIVAAVHLVVSAVATLHLIGPIIPAPADTIIYRSRFLDALCLIPLWPIVVVGIIVRDSTQYGYFIGDLLLPPNLGTLAFPANSLAQAAALVRGIRKLKQRRTEPSPAAYPGGRADAPAGSAEA